MNLAAPVFADKFVNKVFEQEHEHLEQFLYNFIKNRFEFAKSNVALIKILIQELAFHSDIQAIFQKQFNEKIKPAINKSLDYYKEKGELINIPERDHYPYDNPNNYRISRNKIYCSTQQRMG
ncbi:hypothetical protein [Virgibacillus sp. DJP39]|uniref:hypothetical protein n=1 Tax=Virgibacillus sp. DJP39 TaxID=3409790 RepID=UPI003BB71CA7